MELLFTNGVKGQVVKGNIVLKSGLKKLETQLNYNYDSIMKVEEDFGIKLIGMLQGVEPNKDLNGRYDFTIIKDHIVCDFTSFNYSLNANIIGLYDLINTKVFGTLDKYYYKIDNTPIFLGTEGHEQELYMSKEEFQRALVESPIFLLIKEESRYKYMYVYDMHAMLDDLQSAVFSVIPMFLRSSEDLFELTNKVVNLISKEKFYSNSWGYHSGNSADIMNSNFMNIITRMTSVLDIITKLTFEICNVPTDFEGYIKFRSGNQYFNNIKRFKGLLSDYRCYEGSLIDINEEFQELINIRNSITHNMFLTSKPKINYKLAANDKEKEFLLSNIFLWDIDDKGNAMRWNNRCRFYSNKTCMQKYLIRQIVKFYDAIDKTVSLLKEYLSEP